MGFAATIVLINISFPITVMTGILDAKDNDDCTTRGDVIVSCTGYEHRGGPLVIGELNSNVPAGDLAGKWTEHKFDMKLVAPNNRRKFEVIVVGSGLAGASAAATLGEQGYKVKVFTYHDSPRRAHSIAAQGGINAAKNYKGDGDSVQRLFYDTIKGGDFRSREANVHRLAEVSVDIIDQMVAQGVPSPASTAACSTTAPSAARRCPAPSTPGARPASSCSSAPTSR